MKRLTPLTLLALLFTALSLSACVVDVHHHHWWG